MAIDEAQTRIVVKEMRPFRAKDVRRDHATKIIADEGTVAMDVGHARMTQGDQETDNTRSYDDMCAVA